MMAFIWLDKANDVTGSCIYIKYNGKKILLECGLYQNNNYLESYNINSAKFQFKPSEIDYVFVGHTHVDHIGLLPRLVKRRFFRENNCFTSNSTTYEAFTL